MSAWRTPERRDIDGAAVKMVAVRSTADSPVAFATAVHAGDDAPFAANRNSMVHRRRSRDQAGRTGKIRRACKHQQSDYGARTEHVFAAPPSRLLAPSASAKARMQELASS